MKKNETPRMKDIIESITGINESKFKNPGIMKNIRATKIRTTPTAKS